MDLDKQQVSKEILDYIHRHKLQPGDLLPSEPDLKEKLGVSRTKLREGIRELETLQIVRVKRGVGTYVGEASLSFLSDILVHRILAPGRSRLLGLQELIEVREMLELGMISQVAGKLTIEQVRQLEVVLQEMDGCCATAELDRQFHQILYSGLENEIASQLITAFWDAFDLVRGNLLEDHSAPGAQALHGEILTAVQKGDEGAARQALIDHFSHLKQRIKASLSRGEE